MTGLTTLAQRMVLTHMVQEILGYWEHQAYGTIDSQFPRGGVTIPSLATRVGSDSRSRHAKG